jgi:PAS domain-containing protein
VWRAAWYPIKSPEGDIVGLSVVVEDITERRQAEEALRHALDSLEQHVAERTAALAESELKFRRLAEGTRDILYTIDCEGRFQYIGPPAGPVRLYRRSISSAAAVPAVHPPGRPGGWCRPISWLRCRRRRACP